MLFNWAQKFARQWFASPRPRQASPRHRPLWLERLEDRTLPSTVTWIAGSGNWDAGANWSTGNVPGTNDVAVISTPSAATITIKSGDSIQVQSVTTDPDDTLSFTGGALQVTTGNSTLSGPLTITGTPSLIANGATANFTANGSTTATGGNFTAQGGATLALPQMTAYSSNSTTFQATGAGSVLDLSALTTLTQQNGLTINALNNGQIKLTGLATLTSTKGINITDTNNARLFNSLTTLNGVTATLDGTDTQAASTWTSFINGNLTVSVGSYSLPGLSDVDQSSLTVSSGGQLTLHGLTSYNSNGTFQAKNTGSMLDISALTSVTQSNGWNVNATNGGQIKMTGLASLTSTKGIAITDTTGGSLVNALTTLNGVQATLDGTDTQAANTWTSLINGSLTVTGGSYTLPGLTDVDQSSLTASNGGQLALPGLTSYNSNGTFQAKNTGSILNVSALTSVAQSNGWNIGATNGGLVNLSGLTSLTSTHGIAFNVDTGGTLLAGNLATATNIAFTEGSTSALGSLTVATGSTFTIKSGGTLSVPANISGAAFTTQSGGMLTAGADNFSLTSIAVPAAISGSNWNGKFSGSATDASGTGIASVGLSFFNGTSYFDGTAFESATPVFNLANLNSTNWNYSIPLALFPVDTICSVGYQALATNGSTQTANPNNLLVSQMAPVVASVVPLRGFVAGGTSVTINGTFLSQATSVTFGNSNPATILQQTPTSITVTSPASLTGNPGTIDVVVTTPQGKSSTSTTDHFTYIVPPTSSMTALPTFSPGSFRVQWSGSADTTLAVYYYDVYVSDDGAAPTPWLTRTTETSAIFTGQDGHTYGFYTVATDTAGDVETFPAAVQTHTLVDAVAPTSSVNALPAITGSTSVPVSWSGTDGSGSGIAGYTIFVSDNGGAYSAWQTNTTATSANFSGVLGHTYRFFSIATDKVGNVQPVVAGGSASAGSPVTDASGDLTAALTITPASVPVPSGTVTNAITVQTQTAFAAPLALASLTSLSGFSTDVAVYTGAANGHPYAYVADTKDITILDVSNPTNPTNVGTFATDVLGQGNFNFDQVDGHYLIVGSHVITNAGSLSLIIYDLTNPLAPTLVSNTSIPYPYLYGMVVEGNTVYFPVSSITFDSGGNIQKQNGDFIAVDISNLSHPALISHDLFSAPAPLGGNFNVNAAAAVNSNIAYAASTTSTGAATQLGEGQLLIVNTTNPSNITTIGTLAIPGTVQLVGVSVYGNRALVVGTTGGWLNPFTNGVTGGLTGNITLTVLDITNPSQPTILNTLVTQAAPANSGAGGDASKLALTNLGNNLFAISDITANGGPGILVVNPTDPNHIIVSTVPALSLTSGMTVSGNVLYAARADGLAIYQISSLASAPVTVSVEVPTGVTPTNFNVPPDSTTPGAGFTTYSWSRTFGFDATTLTFSWTAPVSGLQVGSSIATTLGGGVQYTDPQGDSESVNLPGTSATGIAVATTLVDPTVLSVSMTGPTAFINNNTPTLTATALASGGSPLANVQFQISSDGGTTWTNAGTPVTTAPFTFHIPTALADGAYEAQAIVTDAAGKSATSAPLAFTVDTVAPTATLTAPVNGGIVTVNTPTLTALATDNLGGSGVASVQFQYSSNNGGTWTPVGGPETDGPFTVTFTTHLLNGHYQARAMVADKAGNSATSPAVSFTVDTVLPTVTMTAPISGSASTNNKPNLTATASDSGGIANVQFQTSADGGATWINAGAPDTAAPYTFTLGTALADGAYLARAVATDNLGGTTLSSPVSFTIDTVAPTVSMTAPANGIATNNAKPTLSATASDDGSGLASVQFQYSSNNGGTWLPAGTPEAAGPFAFAFTTALANGHYQARAIATDKAGNHATASAVAFTIDTVAPTVAMTGPVSGTTLINNRPTLSASASDTGSGLASVQIQFSTDNGVTWINEGAPETTGPFSFTFNTSLPDGAYKARAVALDDAGNTATSVVDSFTVRFALASPTLAVTPGTTVALGSANKLTASATLASGSTPTGTITFNLIAPNGTTVVDTETAAVINNGVFSTPTGFVPNAAGTYQWVAIYSGDSANHTVTSTKVSEIVTMGTPTVTTIPGATVVLGAGTKLTASANLASGYNPTGTITFVLTSPTGVVVDTERATVIANGQYATTTGFSPTPAGAYHWAVSYSGDSNNKAASSPAANGPEIVVGPGATVVGTTLYLVGGSGDDSIQIRPNGTSNTGSTGIVVNALLKGVSLLNTYTQAFAAINISGFAGNDSVQMTSSLAIAAIVSEGDGNDSVQLGNGNNVVITGNGADFIQTGNGNNLIAAGLGQHVVSAGNGSNILIDGSVQLNQSGDSLAAVLSDWTQFGSAAANVASIHERLNVTFNSTAANVLTAGQGLDWFWDTFGLDTTNKKATDLLN